MRKRNLQAERNCKQEGLWWPQGHPKELHEQEPKEIAGEGTGWRSHGCLCCLYQC